MSCETILTQLRSAVAGEAYTDELRDTLETHNCYGFPNRPAKTPNNIQRISIFIFLSFL